MRGDEVIAADDFDLFDAAHDGDVLVSIRRRDGVMNAGRKVQRLGDCRRSVEKCSALADRPGGGDDGVL